MNVLPAESHYRTTRSIGFIHFLGSFVAASSGPECAILGAWDDFGPRFC
jgi:hypothetical protein